MSLVLTKFFCLGPLLEYKYLFFLLYSHFLLHMVVPRVCFSPYTITVRHHRINIKIRFLDLNFDECCFKDKDTSRPNKARAILRDLC